MQDTEKEIIVRAARGEIEAFEELFKAYSPFVYNVALRMAYIEADAKDIAQEVFVLLHRKLSEFKFQSALKTWVYRITVNTTLNYLKRRTRTQTASLDDGPGFEPIDNATSADIAQNRELIEMSLGRLTLDQRVCVVLRTIQGLSYSEIAQTLGIDENVVRSRLKRAREKLAGFKQEVRV